MGSYINVLIISKCGIVTSLQSRNFTFGHWFGKLKLFRRGNSNTVNGFHRSSYLGWNDTVVRFKHS